LRQNFVESSVSFMDIGGQDENIYTFRRQQQEPNR